MNDLTMTEASSVHAARRAFGRGGALPSARFVGPLAALLYPFWLDGFHLCVERLQSIEGAEAGLVRAAAGALLALAVATPAAAFLAARRLAGAEAATVAQMRATRVAFLAVAAPPLYTGVGVALYMAGTPDLDRGLVSALWIAAILLVAAPDATPAARKPHPLRGLRAAHRFIATAIAIFVLAHIVNHAFGLIGPDAQMGVMRILRKAYRLSVVEPLLVAAFLLQAGSGGYLAWRAGGRRMDGFRAFQLASGGYLFFFIASHLNAVFVLARSYLKIDSNWDFATGAPTGLIQDPWSIRLVPHYGWAVFFALGHALAAIRAIALARGASRVHADRVVIWGAVGAALVATLILLGMCGARVGFA